MRCCAEDERLGVCFARRHVSLIRDASAQRGAINQLLMTRCIVVISTLRPHGERGDLIVSDRSSVRVVGRVFISFIRSSCLMRFT